jgi:acyl-CoA reductase-like NAD-dependent aldehyde dehydrogenase
MSQRYGHYINGQYTHSPLSFQNTFCDPLQGLKTLSFSQLSLKDNSSHELIEATLEGCQLTYQQMREGFFPLSERLDFLTRLHKRLSEHQNHMAELICRESHKPIQLAQIEVTRALTTLEETIKAAPLILNAKEQTSITPLPNLKIVIEKQSKGPLLAITPFNFPLNLVAHKVFPAIASGTPVILKPSEKTPLVALYLIDLCHHERLPAGCLQLIHCDHEVVQKKLCLDSRIALLSFTGSSKVGWSLPTHLRMQKTLELGGNAPVYVDQSANLKNAAHKLALSAYSYAGQSCISTQNIYAHKEIHSELLKLLILETEKFPFGDPLKADVLCGPPIDSDALKRIHENIQLLKDNGATIIAQSKNYLGDVEKQKEYIEPTLLINVPEKSEFCQEEIFAPMASLTSVENYQEWTKILKTRSHRLQCALFTQDIEQLNSISELDYGGVIVNEAPSFRMDAFPYGGRGLAGLGSEGPQYAIEEYTQYQSRFYFSYL